MTHLLGVGHLARAAAIGRALARAGHRVTLVSGGPDAPLVDRTGLRVVQLPPVRSDGTDFARLLDAHSGEPAAPSLFAARRDALLAALDDAAPEVVVTELFPFGRRALAGEFLALVEAAQSRRPRPLVLASIRDILVPPSKPERVAESHARLLALYDAVLVHGDPALAPLEASWPDTRVLASRLHYTGYVEEEAQPPQNPTADTDASRSDEPDGTDEILVSGGGSAAGLPLYRVALDAARRLPERHWHILVGGGVPAAQRERLVADAPPNVRVEPARADFPARLARCAVSVSQAGYNTVLDLLRARARAVLVPFEENRESEQRLRADRLAARGLATLLPAAELTGERLAAAVAETATRARPDASAIDRNGAAASVRLVETLHARHATGIAAPAVWPPRLAAEPVRDALARAADAGQPVAIWWRDDDAVAPSPALERLLALSRDSGTPVAIASIPMAAHADLAVRLAGEPGATLLVHGYIHVNHAAAGEKSAEFGAHRPLTARAAEAQAGLRRLRDMAEAAGAAFAPVFVPPWNRLAPDLPAALAGFGYRGLSTFRDRAAREAVPGLIQVNTHLDPIDWRGTRSAIDPDALIAQTAHAILARLDGRADPREPIGLLTHHRVHDACVWDLTRHWLALFEDAEGVSRPDPAALFSPPSTEE